MLRFFRETCATLPDEMMLAAGLLTAPDGSGAKLVGILAAHCGSLADGEAAVKPIKAFGPPVMDAMGPIPYCAAERPARCRRSRRARSTTGRRSS